MQCHRMREIVLKELLRSDYPNDIEDLVQDATIPQCQGSECPLWCKHNPKGSFSFDARGHCRDNPDAIPWPDPAQKESGEQEDADDE